MVDFLVVIGSFVGGLFGLTVPGLGLTFGQMILGLWLFYAIGYFVMSFLHGGED